MDLYKSQKQKQQKEYDGDCNCAVWKTKNIAIYDREMDEVEYEEVCSQCGKITTDKIKDNYT